MLAESVKKFELGVADAVSVELKPNEFDALVSFAYNVGLGAFNSSTLLRRLNDGEKPTRVIVEELPKWCMAGVQNSQDSLEDVKRRFATHASNEH